MLRQIQQGSNCISWHHFSAQDFYEATEYDVNIIWTCTVSFYTHSMESSGVTGLPFSGSVDSTMTITQTSETELRKILK